MSSRLSITDWTGTYAENIEKLKNIFENCDSVVIGAGAGLSTAAGLTYSGERFEKYFFDFAKSFGITDMYSGGFYPFPDKETMWAWWSRAIYINRYMKAPNGLYDDLIKLVKGKDYFVITTNVDHQFQLAGIDKKRLFYTQGDYGLFQVVGGKIKETYDNENEIIKMIEAQGFVKNDDGIYDVPKDKNILMQIPKNLIPKSPNGLDVTMNLRGDDTFVEDEGWVEASIRYSDFIEKRKNQKVLYMELGVGGNTPVIIKYPFWKMVSENPNATYACINYGEAFCPTEIADRSIVINEDIFKVINDLK